MEAIFILHEVWLFCEKHKDIQAYINIVCFSKNLSVYVYLKEKKEPVAIIW